MSKSNSCHICKVKCNGIEIFKIVNDVPKVVKVCPGCHKAAKSGIHDDDGKLNYFMPESIVEARVLEALMRREAAAFDIDSGNFINFLPLPSHGFKPGQVITIKGKEISPEKMPLIYDISLLMPMVIVGPRFRSHPRLDYVKFDLHLGLLDCKRCGGREKVKMIIHDDTTWGLDVTSMFNFCDLCKKHENCFRVAGIN